MSSYFYCVQYSSESYKDLQKKLHEMLFPKVWLVLYINMQYSDDETLNLKQTCNTRSVWDDCEVREVTAILITPIKPRNYWPEAATVGRDSQCLETNGWLLRGLKNESEWERRMKDGGKWLAGGSQPTDE